MSKGKGKMEGGRKSGEGGKGKMEGETEERRVERGEGSE